MDKTEKEKLTNNEKAVIDLRKSLSILDMDDNSREQYINFAIDNIPNLSVMNMYILAAAFFYFNRSNDELSNPVNLRIMNEIINKITPKLAEKTSNTKNLIDNIKISITKYLFYIDDLYKNIFFS